MYTLIHVSMYTKVFGITNNYLDLGIVPSKYIKKWDFVHDKDSPFSTDKSYILYTNSMTLS